MTIRCYPLLRKFFTAGFLLLLLSPSLSAEEATKNSTEKDEASNKTQRIALLIEQLDAPGFKARRKASNALRKLGKEAEAALEEVKDSPNPEIRFRSREILRDFRYGIYPGVSGNIVEQLRIFRSGGAPERKEVIGVLSVLGEFDLALKLLRTVENENLRQDLMAKLTANIDSSVRKFLDEGNFDRAGMLLELAADVPASRRKCALFHHYNGSLESRIEDLRKRSSDDKSLQRLLLWMLRVKGDLKEALALAETLEDENAAQEIRVVMGGPLAYAREFFQEKKTEDIEDLGFKLAYHRLNGDSKEIEETTNRIKIWASDSDGRTELLMKALLLNDKGDEALEYIRRTNPILAHQLFIHQGRWIEALDSTGITNPSPPYDDWLEKFAGELGSKKDIKARDFTPAMQAARFCMRLGERKQAIAIFKKVADILAREKPSLLPLVVYHERSVLGLEDLAYEHARLSIRKNDGDHLATVGGLRYGNSTVALSWYGWLRNEYPDDDERTTLERLDALLVPARALEVKPTAKEMLQLASDTFEASGYKESSLDFTAFLYAFEMQNLPEKTQQYLKILAEKDTAAGSPDRLKLANFLSGRGQWKESVEHYAKASEAAPEDPERVYLHARSLENASGNDAAAEDVAMVENLIQRARILAMSDTEKRSKLIEAMWDTRDYQRCIDECHLLMRTISFFQWDYSRASQLIGDYAKSKKEWKKGAEYLEIAYLRALSNVSYRNSYLPYFSLPRTVYEMRTKAAVEEGKLDKAIEYARVCVRTMPADSLPLEEIAFVLDQAGLEAEVDKLFQPVFDLAVKKVETFPNSPQAHNNLAWLCGRCNRRLDIGLIHAKKAVDLAPDSAAYLDTLAEVHFALGDRDRAIEFSEEAVALEPADRQLKEQLERFKSAPLPESEPPPPPPRLLGD